jgi:hypothetical protein
MPAARAADRILRSIPKTGEAIPAVGLGTWQAFDVAGDGASTAQAREALKALVELGGRVIDSSPMYGSAETVSGQLAEELGVTSKLFVATKVGRRQAGGIRQMEDSMRAAPRRAPRPDAGTTWWMHPHLDVARVESRSRALCRPDPPPRQGRTASRARDQTRGRRLRAVNTRSPSRSRAGLLRGRREPHRGDREQTLRRGRDVFRVRASRARMGRSRLRAGRGSSSNGSSPIHPVTTLSRDAQRQTRRG